MSFFNILRDFVKSGEISQQCAYLAQLIESGVRTKEELSEEINKNIRTVERQLKELYKTGIICNKNGVLLIATNLPIEETFKNIYLDKIDISIDKNVVDKNALVEASLILDCRIEKIKQAVINSAVNASEDMILQAAEITKNMKPKSPIGYFVAVLRDLFFNKTNKKEEKCNKESHDVIQKSQDVWENTLKKLKPLISKSTYRFMSQEIKCVTVNKSLYLTSKNKQDSKIMYDLYKSLLEPFGILGYV